jgi:hypothetical protein
VNGVGKQWPEGSREALEAARRLYARVLVEHERVRQAGPRAVRPSAPLWKPLHDLALFHGLRRRRAPLTHFCADFRDAEEVPRSVPADAYRAALRVALDLAADQLVRLGGGTPWGRGRRRAPESAEDFEALCRALRDADESGAIAGILDEAEPPARGTAAGLPRVVFYVPGKLLVIGDTRIALPEGREYEFLRTLATRRKAGEVTPTEEHGVAWKTAVDQLRDRIRKATGERLLRAVVLSAKAPDREAWLQTFSPEVLERLGRTSRRRPRGRDLRGESEDG